MVTELLSPETLIPISSLLPICGVVLWVSKFKSQTEEKLSEHDKKIEIQEEFRTEVIDRLARIETKLDNQTKG